MRTQRCFKWQHLKLHIIHGVAAAGATAAVCHVKVQSFRHAKMSVCICCRVMDSVQRGVQLQLPPQPATTVPAASCTLLAAYKWRGIKT